VSKANPDAARNKWSIIERPPLNLNFSIDRPETKHMRAALKMLLVSSIAMAVAGPGAAQTPAQSANPSAAIAKLPDGAYLGTWKNPSGSVRIRAARCGNLVCGTILFAIDKAKADAKRGGTDPLIGTQLFEEFTARGPNQWRGRVFVPDMNRRVTGTATLETPNTIRVEGCAAKVICRNQLWTRVPS
jgi:uncharacterized protein (DUF2147 family)